jgi:hypothetical protein
MSDDRAAERLTYRAQRLLEANRASPLEYQSADSDRDEITFRLKNGQKFEINTAEARALSAAGFVPRWAHLPQVYP